MGNLSRKCLERNPPTEAGLDPNRWRFFLAEIDLKHAGFAGQEDEGDNWGVSLTRGGYLVHTWGNPHYRHHTASVGKTFTWAVLGLAVDAGLVRADDPIHHTWTGQGQLSHPHKYLDRGHHKTLTWRLLGERRKDLQHWSGFPVTNGYYWHQRLYQGRQGAVQRKDSSDNPIPAWADWTGDPMYDNYAHVEPGTVGIYSSGGIWRLSQALTALWDQDIKQVLDENLFTKIGIPADRWEWLPGRAVHKDRNFYPHMPGYGDFVDPPYEINGHTVRGGPGWVIMSALDMARFGHLVATQGVWKGQRLPSPEWLISHGGGNGSLCAGESTHFTALQIQNDFGLAEMLPDIARDNSRLGVMLENILLIILFTVFSQIILDPLFIHT